MPVESDVLMISVIAGRSMWRQLERRIAGRGSSSQVLILIFLMRSPTYLMVTGWKEASTVNEGDGVKGVWLRVVRICSILSVKKVEKRSVSSLVLWMVGSRDEVDAPRRSDMTVNSCLGEEAWRMRSLKCCVLAEVMAFFTRCFLSL